MKKNLMATCAFVILGAFLYGRSQDSVEKKAEQKAPEPIATITETKKMLTELRKSLVDLQIKIAANQEKLAKMLLQWKRERKIQFAENWNQTNLGINKLLSTLQQIASNVDQIEKLRRNDEAYNALKNLSQQVKPLEKTVNIKQIMDQAKLFGRALFVDKLFDKLDKVKEIKPKEDEPKPTEAPLFTDYESTYTSGEFDYGAPPSPIEPYYDDYNGNSSYSLDDSYDMDFGSFDLGF